MRIDLPQCGFKNCRYQFDGNCISESKTRYEKCEYKYYKDKVESPWIPCIERLPEDNEEVLFCDRKGERWLGWHYGFWNTERLDFDEDEVVAWMPLPESWKGEQP